MTLALAHWLPAMSIAGTRQPPAASAGCPGSPWLWREFGDIGLLLHFIVCGMVETRHGRSAMIDVAGPGRLGSLAVAITAAQLLPVVEFTQRTSRAAAAGTHEIYEFSLEPYRLIEMAWPNIMGDQFAGNTFWGDIIRIPGVRPKVWVPSLYAGGLTLVLALASIGLPDRAALAHLVQRDRGRERAGKPGPVHQPDLGARGDSPPGPALSSFKRWIPEAGGH